MASDLDYTQSTGQSPNQPPRQTNSQSNNQTTNQFNNSFFNQYTNPSGQASTQTGGVQPTPDYSQIARIAARLLLISTFIINTTKDNNLLILASLISLSAGGLLIRSALLEASEQQLAPGLTTLANKLKVIGTTGSIFFSLLLFIALIREISIKQQPTIVGQTAVAGTAGALFV